MAIILAQAEDNLRAYYKQYTNDTDAQIRGHINSLRFSVGITGRVQDEYEYTASGFIYSFYFAGKLPSSEDAFEEFFPLYREQYFAAIDATEFVKALMPTASAQTASTIIAVLESKALSVQDLMIGWVSMGSPVNAGLSGTAILEGLVETGYYVPETPGVTPLPDDGDITLPGGPTQPIDIPEVSLNLPVNDTHADLLTAVYVAAFSRAPEHEGLLYWAGDLAKALARQHPDDALKTVAASMYFSGAANAEAGTSLSNDAYVQHLYNGVLGRQAEASGHQYWTTYLDQGGSRSEFIAVFLASALASSGDSDYVMARVSVAQYAAQSSVSGKGAAPIDLVAVLDGVHDTASAQAAIATIHVSLSPGWPNAMDSALWDELSAPIDWIGVAAADAGLEVVGIATMVESELLG